MRVKGTTKNLVSCVTFLQYFRRNLIARLQLRIKDKNLEPTFIPWEMIVNSRYSGAAWIFVLRARKWPPLNIRFEEHST